MNGRKQRVMDEIGMAWPKQIEHLQALVREPSTLGNEAGVQRLMQGTFREMGLTVHSFEPDLGRLYKLRGFSPVDWSYDGRPNVVGVLKAAEQGGRSLVLNGHIDVVSPEPVHFWTHDPWGARIVDDRLYGRGACDMKSGISIYTYAVKAIQAAGITLKGDLILQSVIEEECGGNGTLACVDRGFIADGVLVTEPFWGQAMIAQMGVMWCRIKVQGRAGHVGNAKLKSGNAIDKTYLLIQGMRELEAELNRNKHHLFKDIPEPVTFNPGVIHGGDWPSSIPGECTLEFRMGYYPDTPIEEAKAMVRDHLLKICRRDDWLKDHPPEMTFVGFHAEGSHTPFDSPLIQTLNAAHEETLGHPLVPATHRGTTDTRFFELYHGIPSTCFGASGAHVHGTDEFVKLSTVLDATKVVAAFILDWCGAAGTAEQQKESV